ncbi:hypothetical protein PHYBLDRAFT_165462 [Phycomyces blakesleeanus NRRL 1555(-)]|uniref:DNA replication helicase domain-containing protein n=1 Tax=Phycomyces blakesleeanus (strain ATCC 8743b / DSM 1359 / FGSC 10004 / NBRC 33097 / NRRL 1555) TaxID=763407 RepID=A0A162XWV9_PHYB8|nr:hypothetical protein PHYBLDRAFT_165462 [Phycomyces blakesleeanus NRRL 1555(-)]OAD76965.1 hypothetical protein PHYBLDRAFT_165462 [Phycomyces blakesleeanus NRRL 1555(-)]|eukprot:XP_018295005.1 hypothetical protein PHYBLDRAFT_165462 [Phycomyces blakesleeanus NRRL 1555(-)]
MSIEFKRCQFPARLAFAMTINKSQGQTLDKVGLYLPDHVFGHGQLYVALSRVRTPNSVKIMVDMSVSGTNQLPITGFFLANDPGKLTITRAAIYQAYIHYTLIQYLMNLSYTPFIYQDLKSLTSLSNWNKNLYKWDLSMYFNFEPK